MNKTVDGKQITVRWHVDNLKISHLNMSAIEDHIKELQSEFGKEAPLSVTRGPIHEYLGMTIDFTKRGTVVFSMLDYIKG